MKRNYTLFLTAISLFSLFQPAAGQTEKIDRNLPVRGFCISAPESNGIDEFVKFIDEELAPRSVNTLILRVDYNYRYESHPELRDSGALTKHQE